MEYGYGDLVNSIYDFEPFAMLIHDTPEIFFSAFYTKAAVELYTNKIQPLGQSIH